MVLLYTARLPCIHQLVQIHRELRKCPTGSFPRLNGKPCPATQAISCPKIEQTKWEKKRIRKRIQTNIRLATFVRNSNSFIFLDDWSISRAISPQTRVLPTFEKFHVSVKLTPRPPRVQKALHLHSYKCNTISITLIFHL